MSISIKGFNPNGAYMVIEHGEYSSDASEFTRFSNQADAVAYAGKYHMVVKVIKEAL